MTVQFKVFFFFPIVLFLMGLGGCDTQSDTSVDVEQETDTFDDFSTDFNAGYCTIVIDSKIPISGYCVKTTETCEGGFSSELQPETRATHNCIEGLDCCAMTDECVGLREAIEPQLGLTSSCTPNSGDAACAQKPGLYNFSVGCDKSNPICCLVPVDIPDAG